MRYSDQEYLIELGRNIAHRRKSLNYTQGDLASMINMEVPNLSVIENGKSNPQLLTLVRICAAIDCNLGDVLPKLERPSTFLLGKSFYTPRKHEKPQAAPKAYPKKPRK